MPGGPTQGPSARCQRGDSGRSAAKPPGYVPTARGVTPDSARPPGRHRRPQAGPRPQSRGPVAMERCRLADTARCATRVASGSRPTVAAPRVISRRRKDVTAGSMPGILAGPRLAGCSPGGTSLQALSRPPASLRSTRRDSVRSGPTQGGGRPPRRCSRRDRAHTRRSRSGGRSLEPPARRCPSRRR